MLHMHLQITAVWHPGLPCVLSALALSLSHTCTRQRAHACTIANTWHPVPVSPVTCCSICLQSRACFCTSLAGGTTLVVVTIFFYSACVTSTACIRVAIIWEITIDQAALRTPNKASVQTQCNGKKHLPFSVSFG